MLNESSVFMKVYRYRLEIQVTIAAGACRVQSL